MRTFIMGSCVSRDTFTAMESDFELTDYVARQSLVSVNSPVPADTIPASTLSSPFQRRMLVGDLAGNALERIDASGRIDLLLWDLTDERLGVHPGTGGWFTRTIEGVREGFYSDQLKHLTFGSDEHFRLWADSLTGWIHALAERDLLDRTLFLQMPWAIRTTAGDPTPMSFGLYAAEANAASFRYQRAIMDAAPQLRMIRPRVPVIARPEHQWGLAPFHFTDEVYADLTSQIRTAVS